MPWTCVCATSSEDGGGMNDPLLRGGQGRSAPDVLRYAWVVGVCVLALVVLGAVG